MFQARMMLAVAALLAVAACNPQRTVHPDPSGAAIRLAVGTSEHSLMAGGQQRTFRVYRPARLPKDTALPLVVMLHGALGTGSQAEQTYGWNERAERGQFLVAYPDGFKRTWAVSPGCCGPAATSGLDDVGFIKEVVSVVSGLAPIDPKRVYATGISNGGMLSYRLACETDVFAAIGPAAATMLGECASPAPISVIHIHGTADQSVPFTGGPGKRDNNGQGANPVKIDGPPIPDLIGTWRETNGCTTPAIDTSAQVTRSVATCPGGRAVELITIDGAGHQWPGHEGPRPGVARILELDPPFMGLDATEVIWQFFHSHPKPAN